VQYHLVHTVVLIALAALLMSTKLPDGSRSWIQRSCTMMLTGILLFSGSLYLMALTSIRPLGMITPIGGISWLVGWGFLLMAATKLPSSQNNS